MADRSPLFHIWPLLILDLDIHVAIYGSYMPSRRLRRLHMPLIQSLLTSITKLSVLTVLSYSCYIH